MKVTPQQWDQANMIFEKIPPHVRLSFSGIRPREIRWLIAAEEDIRPQYKARIQESRKALLKIFEEHALTEAACRELMARLLILGKTQIFRKLESVPDPVEIDSNSNRNGHDNGVRSKLEGMALDLLDQDFLGRDTAPDDLMPFQARYGITREEFESLYITRLKRDRLRLYEPFLSSNQRLRSRRQKQWQFSEVPFAVGAKADKKEDFTSRICEDDIFLMEHDFFHLGAVFDGLGCADNDMNVLWQEVLKKSLNKYLRVWTGTIDENSLLLFLQKAIWAAQKRMKQIFADLNPSVVLHRRDLPKLEPEKVERFDRLCTKLQAQGLPVEEDLRWYVLNSTASTTMEMIVLPPGGKGYLCRVGDGQSLLVQRKTARVIPIGIRRKNPDHTTAYLGVYRHLRSLEIIPFSYEPGDIVLTMTDGPGDTYESPNQLERLGRLFLSEPTLQKGLFRFCATVDRNSARKRDDYALVALQTTRAG